MNEKLYKKIKLVLEKLELYAGEGENRRIILQPFLKIVDKKGLVFTVTDVNLDDIEDPLINAVRFDDNGNPEFLVIDNANIANYTRQD